MNFQIYYYTKKKLKNSKAKLQLSSLHEHKKVVLGAGCYNMLYKFLISQRCSVSWSTFGYKNTKIIYLVFNVYLTDF